MSYVNSYSELDGGQDYPWSAPVGWNTSNCTWSSYSIVHLFTIISDSASVHEVFLSSSSLLINQFLSVFDNVIDSSTFSEVIVDSVSVIDNNSKSLNGLYFNSVSVIDNNFKSLNGLYFNGVSIIDNNSKSLNCLYSSDISVIDSNSNLVEFNRVIVDDVSIVDSNSFVNNFLTFDTFGISDVIGFSCSLVSNENLNFVDAISSVSSFNSVLGEYVGLFDGLSSAFSNNLNDSVSYYDNFFRGIDFVVSSLSVLERDMTVNDFYNLCDRPYGYSSFAEFVVGEYEYKDAIIKTTVSSSNINNNTEIDKLDFHVDIPDTDDRGMAYVSAVSTFVEFNKSYYNTPENIGIIVSGGSSSDVVIPRLISSSNLGFYVELRNSAGTLVDGTISWSSKGY